MAKNTNRKPLKPNKNKKTPRPPANAPANASSKATVETTKAKSIKFDLTRDSGEASSGSGQGKRKPMRHHTQAPTDPPKTSGNASSTLGQQRPDIMGGPTQTPVKAPTPGPLVINKRQLDLDSKGRPKTYAPSLNMSLLSPPTSPEQPSGPSAGTGCPPVTEGGENKPIESPIRRTSPLQVLAGTTTDTEGIPDDPALKKCENTIANLDIPSMYQQPSVEEFIKTYGMEPATARLVNQEMSYRLLLDRYTRTKAMLAKGIEESKNKLRELDERINRPMSSKMMIKINEERERHERRLGYYHGRFMVIDERMTVLYTSLVLITRTGALMRETIDKMEPIDTNTDKNMAEDIDTTKAVDTAKVMDTAKVVNTNTDMDTDTDTDGSNGKNKCESMMTGCMDCFKKMGTFFKRKLMRKKKV